MVRIDMSEYMEKHSVSRLIGAPPGYVGYDEGGQFTERFVAVPTRSCSSTKSRRRIRKSSTSCCNPRRWTPHRRQRPQVDFKNTVIIMTSNIGSAALEGEGSRCEEGFEEASKQVMNALHAHFQPEFLNRVDDIIIFHPLGKEQFAQIIDLRLEEFAACSPTARSRSS